MIDTQPPRSAHHRLLVIAHRGASADAPENTLAAVRLAWEMGADAVEVDVRRTRDGRIVVIHDEDTARIAGVRHVVADTDAAMLRHLDVGGRFDARFAGERIPFLEEMLDTVPSGGLIAVEIKDGPGSAPAIADIVAAHPARGGVTFISFDPASLAAIRRLLPDRPAFLVADRGGRRRSGGTRGLIELALGHGFAGIDADHRMISEGFADAVLVRGLALWCWTVDDAAAARRMVSRGVVGITTNRPDLVQTALAAE